MLYRQFYSELGKLLYAIADIDGVISKKEKETLKHLVKKELAPRERHKDEFGNDVAYYTEIEFDFLDEMIAEPEVAFESFINFIQEHKTAIDKPMIESIRIVSTKLAEAYYQTSKKEKELLIQVNQILDQLLKEK